MDRYQPYEIEAKWQQVWEEEQTFHTPNPAPGDPPDDTHWYQLEMLPYPSGTLHMGHVLNYTMGDVLTHFRRRNGWTVLRPMGFDSFGLPAENAAIREGGHPREIVERNIEAIRVQMKRLGWAIDWQREVSSHEVGFYRWTQWLFLEFFERGLAYRRAAPVNWCPNDQTVLSNEHVVDGRCWRCGARVEARNMEQWFFRITAYADELLEYELPPGGDWPERTKTIQRNWIGRSEGAEILFRIEELDTDIPVFTTRPDTLFGATFFVLAPEHPLVERIGTEEVLAYARQTAAKRGEERETEEVKTGVFTGYYATNPVNGERLPIYVADYVLMDYGTGAIMAVPAHDERDREFAEAFGLPVVEVISEEGMLVNSGEFDGLPAAGGQAGDRRVAARAGKGRGGGLVPPARLEHVAAALLGLPDPDRVLRRLRASSRCPRTSCRSCCRRSRTTARRACAPLASNQEWLHVPCPRCGGPGTREADTMDTFVDSSWYFLRYVDPHNDRAPFDRRVVDYWCPITQYIGGIDHATGHLLYSRFFVKVMNELGLVGLPRAVRTPVPPGVGADGRIEDVEVAGQRCRAGRAGRRVRRRRGAPVHPLHGPGRPGPGVDRERHRGDLAVRPAAVAGRARGRRLGAGGRAGQRAAGAQGARDDRARDRRCRSSIPVPHADLGGDGAGQRAGGRHGRAGREIRGGDGAVARTALGAARDRGAVAACWATSACGSIPGPRPIPRCSSATRSSWSCR